MRLSRTLSFVFVFVFILIFLISHNFANAEEGYINNNPMVIDGIIYERGESSFSKIITSPSDSSNPSESSEAYTADQYQDSYPSLGGQTIAPTVVCDDPSGTNCYSIGIPGTAIGEPVYGDFYNETALWQKVSINGEIYYVPMDELNYGGGVVDGGGKVGNNVQGVPTNEVVYGNTFQNNGVTKNVQKIEATDEYSVDSGIAYPFKLSISLRGCKNPSSSLYTKCNTFSIGTNLKLQDYFDASLYFYRAYLVENYGNDSYYSRCGVDTVKAGVCEKSMMVTKNNEDDEDVEIILELFKGVLMKLTQSGIIKKTDHLNRNNEMDVPSNLSKANALKWMQMVDSKSVLHRIGLENLNNIKMISPDGLSEAVYSASGKLVTDPTNYGTYNFANPNNNVEHTVYDILPYLIWGNDKTGDRTNIISRALCGNINLCPNTINDEFKILKYEVKEEVKDEIIKINNKIKNTVVNTTNVIKTTAKKAYNTTKNSIKKAADKTKKISSFLGSTVKGWFK